MAPRFRNPSANAVAGVAMLAGAWWFLYQAYDNTGRKLPAILRPIAWW